MRCSTCGHANSVEAKFCEMCAAPLARICASCGSQLSPIAKFCPECAHPTSAEARQPRFISPETSELRRTQGMEVRIRIGINSGDVVVRAIGSDLRMDYTAVGRTTHFAARMEQLAAPGSVRITPGTLRLTEGSVEVASLGPVPVKGLPEPVEVFELLGAYAARTRLEATAGRGLTRFVGRGAATADRRGRLVCRYFGQVF